MKIVFTSSYKTYSKEKKTLYFKFLGYNFLNKCDLIFFTYTLERMKYYLSIHIFISFSWMYPKDVFKFLCSQ